MKRNITLLLLVLCSSSIVFGQDTSLLKMLDDSLTMEKQWGSATGTFKATQIINTPTVEAPDKGGLQFLIMHRFGRINEGAYALFGLDNATIRFGLDYGITDRLSIGVGRSSFDKTYDGNLKWKLLQQAKGSSPFTISIYELLTHTTLRYTDKPYMNARYRTAYTSQLLIARKFNANLSLQLSPAWHHFNLVPTAEDKNNVFTIGIGGRLKITKRISINGEYGYLPSNQVVTNKVYNSLAFGMDIETGGHVFQLVFTNSQGMIGPYYLTKTDGNWGDGDIYFGFNISRYFKLKHR